MTMNDFLQKLFERAKAEGFEASEAYIASGESFEAGVFAGEINDYNVVGSMGLGFRALISGKMGYASTQVLDDDAVTLLIEGVKTNARLIENEDKQFIFPGSERYPALDVYNEALEHIDTAEKLRAVKALEQETLRIDPRVTQTQDCRVFSESGFCRIVNSMGLDVFHRDNAIGMYTVPIAREGDRVNTGMEIAMGRDANVLDAAGVAKRACEEALAGLHAATVPSGTYKIVLRNDVAATLLRTFASVFSADAAQKGLSLLKGREGEKIASDAVTIVDDPLLPEGRASCPFDGEGVAAYRKAVVEKGVLNTLLHNLKTAAKQGVTTTANASRASYSSPVGVSSTNFFVERGAYTRDALLGMADGGLLITELQGMHSGANGISGDFSLSARGFRIENGAPGAAVDQITVAGNFFQALHDVEAVADDLLFAMAGSFGAPSILLKGLSVAGA